MDVPKKDVIQNHQIDAQKFLLNVTRSLTNLVISPQMILKSIFSFSVPNGPTVGVTRKLDVNIVANGTAIKVMIPVHAVNRMIEAVKDLDKDDTLGVVLSLESENGYDEKMNNWVRHRQEEKKKK